MTGDVAKPEVGEEMFYIPAVKGLKIGDFLDFQLDSGQWAVGVVADITTHHGRDIAWFRKMDHG